MNKLLKIISIASILGLTANAQAVLIDFESDTVGNKGNSFVSNDSPLVTFSGGTNVSIGDYFPEAISRGLGAFGHGTGLTMNFGVLIDSLSMAFGNDDPNFPEDRAILTVFNGLAQVGQTILVYNKNDLPDQTIAISGVGAFDKAHLIFVGANGQSGTALAEVVDNIEFTESNRVPDSASTVMLLGLGLGAIAMIRRRS